MKKLGENAWHVAEKMAEEVTQKIDSIPEEELKETWKKIWKIVGFDLCWEGWMFYAKYNKDDHYEYTEK